MSRRARSHRGLDLLVTELLDLLGEPNRGLRDHQRGPQLSPGSGAARPARPGSQRRAARSPRCPVRSLRRDRGVPLQLTQYGDPETLAGTLGGGGVGCHHESRTSGRARTGRLTRIEPAMSVPCAIAPIPTATAAAAPPLEPPGVSAGSQGFSASGREVVVAEPAEGKGRHVRPADDDRAAGSEIHDRRTASAEML